jgi:hypothetical protein
MGKGNQMRKHPKANQPVTIKNGDLKGRTFIVIDFVTSMHQGKRIEKIKIPQLARIRNSKLPLDQDVVFGKLYPSMEFICLHDSELKYSKADEEKVVELKKKVNPRKKKEDVTKGSA